MLTDYSTLFHNCLSVEQKPGGLLPRRYTKEQLEHWRSNGEVRFSRAKSTAGITLRFRTDAMNISFSYVVESSCGEKMTFDLYEDDTLASSATHLTAGGKGTVSLSRILGGKEREITVYLPFTAELILHSFSLGDAEPISRDRYQKRVLWLGDSISQGMHAQHPSQTLAGIFGRKWGQSVEIVNQGVGGAGFKDIPQAFTYDQWDATDLVILLGTNDTGAWLAAPEYYHQQIKDSLDHALEQFPADRIHLITPFWRTDVVKNEIGVPFYKILDLLREESKARGIEVIEGYNSNPRNCDFFWDQRLHPNDIGFSVICENLEDKLSSIKN